MHIHFPFHIDGKGRTREAGEDDYIRQLIEQVLFTSPGERVNRPEFGTGLLQMVFEPNSTELAAATEFTVQAALQQWLGDLITVQSVAVTANDSRLNVQVSYTVNRDQQPRTAEFSKERTG